MFRRRRWRSCRKYSTGLTLVCCDASGMSQGNMYVSHLVSTLFLSPVNDVMMVQREMRRVTEMGMSSLPPLPFHLLFYLTPRTLALAFQWSVTKGDRQRWRTRCLIAPSLSLWFWNPSTTSRLLHLVGVLWLLLVRHFLRFSPTRSTSSTRVFTSG
jgi:hypothetical protein